MSKFDGIVKMEIDRRALGMLKKDFLIIYLEIKKGFNLLNLQNIFQRIFESPFFPLRADIKPHKNLI